MSIGLVHDPMFQEHDPGNYHCESPHRLVALEKALSGWPKREQTRTITLRPATDEEILRIHHPDHLRAMASTKGRSVRLDPDTSTSPLSFDAALMAAGGLIDLADAALAGEVEHGMALVRPPGHHAMRQRAMGFCLFNNIAIAAAHLKVVKGLERILVVDWDVHHGNGTEDSFYQDPGVLYFSVHQSPFYPGTGHMQALGKGPGEGHNINVPLSARHDNFDYIRIFEDLLVPVARQYKPQFILVSAGFDCHNEDPLGGMYLTDQGFAAMTRVLDEISQEFCPGRVVMTLEGGYNFEAQARSVLAVLSALLGDASADELRRAAAGSQRPPALINAIKAAGQFWEFN